MKGAGHIAGLTNVILIPGAEAKLTLVLGGLLSNFVLVLDPLTVIVELGRDLGEVAEMTLKYKHILCQILTAKQPTEKTGWTLVFLLI